MLVVQCLLLVIALTIGSGLLVVYSILHDIRRIQAQSHLVLQKHAKELLGDYSDGMLQDLAYDLKRVAKFTSDARDGRIPYLRYDDWYARKEDLERWDHAAIMAAAEAK